MEEFSSKLDELYFRLSIAIENFQKDFPTIVEQTYFESYLKGFNNYLLALNYLEKDIADYIVKLGQAISSNYSTINSSGGEIGAIYIATEELLQVEISDSLIKGCIVDFILVREPEKFSHNPRVDIDITINAQNVWRTNIRLYSHDLATKYLDSPLHINRDIVMRKYQSLREKYDRMGGVRKSHEDLIKWIESYGESIHSVSEKVKLQLFEQDSFNQAFLRWKKATTKLS